MPNENNKPNVQNKQGTSINGASPVDNTIDTNSAAATPDVATPENEQEGKTPQSAPQTPNNAAAQNAQGNNPRPIASQIHDADAPKTELDNQLKPQGADPANAGVDGAYTSSRVHRDIV